MVQALSDRPRSTDPWQKSPASLAEVQPKVLSGTCFHGSKEPSRAPRCHVDVQAKRTTHESWIVSPEMRYLCFSSHLSAISIY
jgi:hypothetical protein